MKQSTTIDINDFSCTFDDMTYLRFGKYPEQREVDTLENAGFRLFVDLTTNNEELSPYILSPSSSRISHPIPDQCVPSDIEALEALTKTVILTIQKDNYVYIHCRGGHGRSAVVTACIMATFYITKQYPVEEAGPLALKKVSQAHDQRKIMNPRWRKLGAPQSGQQKAFVLAYAKTAANK